MKMLLQIKYYFIYLYSSINLNIKVMGNNLICREDVKSVADRLKIKATEEQITEIMREYPLAQADDEYSMWYEVVESMLYNLID